MKLALSVAILSLVLTTTAVFAVKPGTYTLAVTPDPVTANSDYHLTGCGYGAGTLLVIQITSPSAYSQSGAQADGDGCFNALLTSHGEGQYKADVWVPTHPNKPAASVGFTVTP